MDLIILFFLTRHIGRLAARKGLRTLPWKLYVILAWITAEIVGLLLAISLFGININDLKSILSGATVKDPLTFFLIELTGLMSAFGGYLIVRATLEKKPDFMDNDINQIGTDDLRPPQNQ